MTGSEYDPDVAAPRIGSMNVVVPDVAAAAAFLQSLGVSIDDMPHDWAGHHRALPTSGSEFDVDLDSPSFAHYWGGVPIAAGTVVVNVLVDTRDAVDEVFATAIEAGARELRAPHDAFWGCRYAVVEAPGPLLVGVMSPQDDSRRSSGPEPSDFT